jgi:hypothetical protein
MIHIIFRRICKPFSVNPYYHIFNNLSYDLMDVTSLIKGILRSFIRFGKWQQSFLKFEKYHLTFWFNFLRNSFNFRFRKLDAHTCYLNNFQSTETFNQQSAVCVLSHPPLSYGYTTYPSKSHWHKKPSGSLPHPPPPPVLTEAHVAPCGLHTKKNNLGM